MTSPSGSKPSEPAPSSSPFERPKIMTGYPLSPAEKKQVDRVVEEAETAEDDEE